MTGKSKNKEITAAQAKGMPRRELCAALGVEHTMGWPDLLERVAQLEAMTKNTGATNPPHTCAFPPRALAALRLPPDATEEPLVVKLVELSDAAHDGKRVVDQLIAALELPTPTTVEAIVAAVKGHRALHEQMAQRLAAPPYERSADEPLFGAHKGQVEVTGDIDKPDENEAACKALDAIRVGLGLEEDARPADIVNEVKWVHEMCGRNRRSSDETDSELTETQDALRWTKGSLDTLRQASWRLASLTAVVGAEGRRLHHLLEKMTFEKDAEEDE